MIAAWVLTLMLQGATPASSAGAAKTEPATPATVPAIAETPSMADPSIEHERLAALTGEWTIVSKWHLNPDGPPEILTGGATTRSILGGRFVESRATSNGAVSVESLTILGFDRRSSSYTFVGFDTLGTYSVTASGKYSDSEKAIVMSGSESDLGTGGTQRFKVRIRMAGENQFVLSFSFELAEGREFLAVESTYTRRTARHS